MNTPPRVLVVDAANVVGSVPDGWWRDRPAAAARLHRDLMARFAEGRLPYDEVVLVLEGQARAGAPATPPTDGRHETRETDIGVRTVHASGSGDDEIVTTCRALTAAGATVTLATADRGLIARVRDLGVVVVGPRSVRTR